MRRKLSLAALTVALLAGCGKSKDKNQVTEAEKAYYAAVIQTAYRPYVSTMSEVAAWDWVCGAKNVDSSTQSALLQELAERLGECSVRIRRMETDDVSIETRGLAEDIACRQARFSLAAAKVRYPDADTEFVGWLADVIALNGKNLDAQQAEELRVNMGMQRLGNYVKGTIQAKAQEIEASADVQRTAQEMKSLIENHRVAIGGIRAAQLINPDDVVQQIVMEQSARAHNASSRVNLGLLSKTLVGKRAAGWTFEPGEIKAVRIIETQLRGHCILTEAEIDVIGSMSGARTLRVRMAHQVFIDDSMQLLAISGVE